MSVADSHGRDARATTLEAPLPLQFRLSQHRRACEWLNTYQEGSKALLTHRAVPEAGAPPRLNCAFQVEWNGAAGWGQRPDDCLSMGLTVQDSYSKSGRTKTRKSEVRRKTSALVFIRG